MFIGLASLSKARAALGESVQAANVQPQYCRHPISPVLRRVVFSRQGFDRFAGALTGWKLSLSGGKMSSTTMVTVAPVSR
jgi:hypothetical protein